MCERQHTSLLLMYATRLVLPRMPRKYSAAPGWKWGANLRQAQRDDVSSQAALLDKIAVPDGCSQEYLAMSSRLTGAGLMLSACSKWGPRSWYTSACVPCTV